MNERQVKKMKKSLKLREQWPPPSHINGVHPLFSIERQMKRMFDSFTAKEKGRMAGYRGEGYVELLGRATEISFQKTALLMRDMDTRRTRARRPQPRRKGSGNTMRAALRAFSRLRPGRR